MRVRWLRRALENLNAEAEYIAQDNHSAACEMFVYVKTSVDKLADFPAIGRPGRVPTAAKISPKHRRVAV